jgi:hypothetical protein
MRVTLERQPGNNGYKVMEGRQEKIHIGYVRPTLHILWQAFDLNYQIKGVASNRLGAARLLQR